MANQGAEGLLSPFLQRRRCNAAKPFLMGKVLDVGCGNGALAKEVPEDRYLGVDTDPVSIKIARLENPLHRFQRTLPDDYHTFDTVVALAVIEHVKSPLEFLIECSKYLKVNKSAKIVITTPHPSIERLHYFGSRIGLFSRHANEEHEELLNYQTLLSAGDGAGLSVFLYKRFLFGGNQIAVFSGLK